MRFTWKAVLLAPLVVPLLFSAALSGAGGNLLAGFLFFLVVSAVISYGTTVLLFLPCLWCASGLARLTLARTSALGAALGGAIWLPVARIEWQASGIDSGPPEDPFSVYLWNQLSGWEIWLFIGSGLVTAAVYWLLAAGGAGASPKPADPDGVTP